MNKHYWPAIILIVIGIILLLHQTDLLDFTGADLISYGSIAIGIILLVNCFNRSDRKGILGGVFFTVFGLSMLLMREYLLPRADEFGFAMFFIALALGNYAYLPFRKDKTNNLVFGSIFAVIGVLLLWAYFGYYPSWYIWEQVETYWPLVLIVIGAVMIINAYRKKSVDAEQIESKI